MPFPAPSLPEVRNVILRGLPPKDLAMLRPHLHSVPLVMRQVLHAVSAPIDHVYFMEEGLTSLTASAGEAAEVEVGLVGREGLVGTGVLLMTGATAIHRAFVQVPGSAYRMQSATFRDALSQFESLRDGCLRYVQFMMVQTAQCAACNARHGLPERLARWLLFSMNRIESDELPMTQEFLSYMLGVRRAGVSVVANGLQSEGLIRQSRGRITLLDRAGLEAKACVCYRLVEDSRARIMEVTSDHKLGTLQYERDCALSGIDNFRT